jgi:CheY-like chemotaxis protein
MRTRVHGCELQPPRYFADSTKVPHTLLLADDSVTIQRVIELTFADEDVQVIAVSDGDQAIERLKASPPDIVLADIGMPGKNGYEVAQYMRQSPALAHIPVVLLTGAFEPVDQARAAETGCDGVLAKPFEPQLVIRRVKELLSTRHGAPQSAGGAAPQAPSPADEWALPLPGGPSIAATPQGQPLDDYFDRLDAAFSSLNPAAAAPPPAPPAAAQPPTVSDSEIDWFSAVPGAAGPIPESWDEPATPPAAATPEPAVTFASPQPPVGFEPPPAFEPQPAFEPAPAFEPPPPDFENIPAFEPTAAFEPPAPFEQPAFEPTLPQPSPGVHDPFGDPRHAAAAVPAYEHARPAAAEIAPRTPWPGAVRLPLPIAETMPPLADAFAALLGAEANEGSSAVAIAWPGSEPAAPVVTDQVIEEIARRVLDRLSDRVVRDTVTDLVSRLAEQLVRDEIERIKASIK